MFLRILNMKFFSLAFYRQYRLQIAFFALFLVVPWVFPQLPAASATNTSLSIVEIKSLFVPVLTTASPEFLLFPEAAPRPARNQIIVTTTAYSSTPDQTDDTPFITASGTNVRWGVVAANFLPIGTLLRIPDYYGEQIFVVEDRMNTRYDYRLDIWMETRTEAKQWGIRNVRVEIL